jgi:hypothetical protein
MITARGDFPCSAGWNEAVAAIRLVEGIIIMCDKSNRVAGHGSTGQAKDRLNYCKCTA